MSMIDTADLGAFFKQMYEMSKTAKDKDDFVKSASEKFGALVEAIIEKVSQKIGVEQGNNIVALQKGGEDKDLKISKLEKTVSDFEERFLRLEKRVKSSENREKRAQKALVATNIIAKTSKTEDDVVKHVLKAISNGLPQGTNKPNRKDILVEELIPRADKGETRGRRSGKVFKVSLYTNDQKKALFVGLAAINKAGYESGITIQNEIPYYLRNYSKELDRVAFTLRTKYKNEKLRTKVVPDGLTLQMQFKCGDDKEWIKASSEILADKLDTIVSYREDEKQPSVLPTCRQVLNRKDNFA